MLNIGCHLSSAKGYLHMLQETESIGVNTFQFFTRNPRGGQAKPMSGGCRSVPHGGGGKKVCADSGTCAVHAQSLRVEGKRPGIYQRYDGRRSCADGVYAGEPV